MKDSWLVGTDVLPVERLYQQLCGVGGGVGRPDVGLQTGLSRPSRPGAQLAVGESSMVLGAGPVRVLGAARTTAAQGQGQNGHA